MHYSRTYRSKLVIWAVLMIVIMIGSSVFAARDAGITHKQTIAPAVQEAIISVDLPILDSTTDVDVRNAGESTIELDTQADIKVPVEPARVDTAGDHSDIYYINDTQYVDLTVVRDTWLQWTNYLRTEQLGRDAYTSDWRVNATAQAWSQYSADIGSISHKRNAGDGYYNYRGLVSWFSWKGQELTGSPIVFANVSRATFSESIGRGMWNCKESDCTDELIQASRSTWNFFYGERSYNGVHYRALTHRNFAIQGLGLATSGNKYYLTIHYGTQIVD